FAWSFGKEPIAGVTPFCQMHSFVEAYERRDLAEKAESRRFGLKRPLRLGGQEYGTVTVSETASQPAAAAADGICMTPLRTPLAATGFTQTTLNLLASKFNDLGFMPMQGGAVSPAIAEREKNSALEPGGPLAVSLITGDFDLSGIGTVTHIDGRRV